MGLSLCGLCGFNIIFGVRAVFGLDAFHLFSQRVLAVIPLIRGVQVCRCMACAGSQEGMGRGWLLVAGPSATEVAAHVPLGKLAPDCGTLGGSGSCAPMQMGAVVGTGSQDPQQRQASHAPGEVCPGSQDPQQWPWWVVRTGGGGGSGWHQVAESSAAVAGHTCPREVGPRSQDPQQWQAMQAPGKVGAVTCTR